MPAPARPTTDTHAEQADLEKLAAELEPHGLQATLRELPGALPCLDVTNPRSSVLTERIYVQSGWFWWSWAERITDCDQPATAATILARVLRTTDGK